MVPPELHVEVSQHATLKPLTEQPVSLTLFRFQGHARKWYSVIASGRGSQSLASSLCQNNGHVLVLVNAYDLNVKIL